MIQILVSQELPRTNERATDRSMVNEVLYE